MASLRQRIGAGRVRWLAAFTLVFVISSTSVVLIAPSQASAGGSTDATAAVGPPDAEDVANGFAAVEAKEREQEEALQAPAAVREREASASSFAGIAAQEAEELLRAKFAGQLAVLNGDPARFLTDAVLDRPFGEFGARITDSKGNTELLESSVPVRAENASRKLKKVDLKLESEHEGFEPQNPLVGLRIGKSVGEGVEVGDRGLSVSQANANASAVGQVFGDKNLFYPEVAADTDLLVAATSGGVEFFDQLRSPQSPETLRFHLDLPTGAELRSDGNGGAQVAKGESTLAEIPAPSAFDAQGAHVPVALEVEGNAIVVSVPRKEDQFAYPILVDPQWITDSFGWSSGYNLEALEESRGIWHWSTNDESQFVHSTYCIYACFEGTPRGLYVSTKNASYAGGKYGEWWYYVPGETTYIPSIYPTASATLSPFNRNNHGCSWEQYRVPNDYDGSFNAAGEWQWFETDRAQWYGNATMYTNAKGIALGMGSGGGVSIPCWRDVRGGGVTVALADPEAPTINWVAATASWVKNLTVTAHASDRGLGVMGVTLAPQGALPHTNEVGCSGLYYSRCPSGDETSFGSGYFAEGEHNASISAYDPLGPDNAEHVSSSYGFKTRLDQGKPEVELEGQLTEAIQEAKTEGEVNKQGAAQLRLPVYNLKIEATDKAATGNPQTEEAARRSGVKNIRVFVDGKEKKVPWGAQGCSGPIYSCPMPETYPLYMNELEGDGTHELKLVAEDQVGNERERTIKFEYFPATGMKEGYVLQHFPLDDGKDHSEEEEYGGPELAVNVMNGNLVFHQKDVEVSGPAVDLEVERFYNSELPEEDNTQWGEGWTLAQTTKLEPEETKEGEAPRKAMMLRSTSALDSAVGLPTEGGGTQFDKKLQAVVTKEPSGGYTVEDQSGQTDATLAFDKAGKVKELQTSGSAKIDYSYEAGDLTEMAVEDPAATNKLPGEINELNGEERPRPPSYEGSFEGPGLWSPIGVAEDPQGNIWVAEPYGGGIAKFNQSGQYLTSIGEGQLSYPSGVAVGPDGSLWVADREYNRIVEFSPSGEYLTSIGEGQLSYPSGVAVGPDGNIWVADTYNSRIEEFSPSGEYLTSVGSEGSGEGQLQHPEGLAIGPDGNIWVADTYNSRIEEFRPSGEYLLQAGVEQLKMPVGIAFDAFGDIWVTGNYAGVAGFDSHGRYLTSFAAESFEGGFSYNHTGIAADAEGNIWVADPEHNRIQHWHSSAEGPANGLYAGAFGSLGSADGQFKEPRGIAADPEGNIWVADSENDRVEEFTLDGTLIRRFGSLGSEDGQFSSPGGIAADPEGNIWVVDTNNNRVQEFNSKGEFIRKFGSSGSGDSQFSLPWGIAVSPPTGDLYVADGANHRVQEFNSKGEFIRKFGSSGSGDGQLSLPLGIAADPQGNLWVSDIFNSRVEKFSSAGRYIRKIPVSAIGVASDRYGNLWVAAGGYIEGFAPWGEYLGQFGSAGSGEGQFSSPNAVVEDPYGNLWIADTNNDRVQRWHLVDSVSEGKTTQDDPKVEIDSRAGLVETVESEEAGKTNYSHSGEELTAVSGPEGQTSYQYDPEGRVSKITLPNGTWGEVRYGEQDGRVKSVKVYDATAKTTKTTIFTYQDAPSRRTTVSPEGESATVYDIGPDGSVLKWWNTNEPPEIQRMWGSLYENRETSNAVAPGDYQLSVQAYSPFGIASIEIIANGNDVVAEQTCTPTPETNCKTVEEPWVTNTGNWAPGILNLEAMATDANGNVTSSRFWVNIPYTPPPNPEADEPPTFEEIKNFREEFGLDLDLKGNEQAIDERIFNLIGDWYNPHTSDGEVARATDERWGVPLRAVDAAELEYRERYIAHDIPILDAWASANFSGSYAGAYVDERSGGLIRMGFTSSQSASVEAAQQLSGLLVPNRIAGFINTPAYSLVSLSSSQSTIAASLPSSPEGLIVSMGIEVEANRIMVGATNVPEASSWLTANFGAEMPTHVEYEESAPVPMSTRRKISGPLYAGDLLVTQTGGTCSAGFGAMQKLANGKKRMFALTAAHCFEVGDNVRRENSAGKTASIGSAKRSGRDPSLKEVTADTVAVGLNGSVNMPRYINQGRGGALPVKALSTMPHSGKYLCHTGYGSDPSGTKNKLCGKVRNGRWFYESKRHDRAEVLFCFEAKIHGGDSGGPVWIRGTHTVVGLATHGRGIIRKEEEKETCATALLPSVVEGKISMPEDAASLTNSKLRPLTLVYAP